MFQVVQFDDKQGDVPPAPELSEESLKPRQEQKKTFDINDAFDFSQNSGGMRHPSEGGTAEQQTIPFDGLSSGSGIGEAM